MKRIAWTAALVTLAVHLIGNPHYGFYRDELYFIVCGFRPDWGYVDQPPLVPLLSAGSQLFGHSLFALRALPALFAAAGVYVSCLFAEEIGGDAFAVGLTALLVATTPVLSAFGAKVSTDMPGLLLWPLAALLVAKLANGAGPRLWIWVGVALGICAEAKYTVMFFAAAAVVGIALTRQRRILATPWFLAGTAAGIAIALPSVVWQAMHGWPLIEMIHNQQRSVIVLHSPAGYMLQQVLITNPLIAAIWIAGTIYAFLQPPLRWIGWTFVLLMAAMIVFHARNYYPGDVYPMVLACGALAIERAARLRRARPVIVAAIGIAGLVTIPFVLPVLAAAQLAAIVGVASQSLQLRIAPARGAAAPLTQTFADMHGWRRLTATVASVYDALPPAQRSHAAILASNYGEAAAIDVFGGRDDLPPALSGHNNYWLWGTHGYDGSVVIEVNGTCGPVFRSARVAVARLVDRWAMPTENGIPISVCYGLKEPLSQYWVHLKNYV